VPSGEYIKTYKQSAKISTSGVDIVSMLRQRRTIGSFSATAGLPVKAVIASTGLQGMKKILKSAVVRRLNIPTS